MNTTDKAPPTCAATVFVNEREVLIELACRIVESRAVAEEIVQESWLRWQGRDYKSSHARPIFRRIVSNLATDWYRSRRAERGLLSDVYAIQSHHPSTEAAVIARNELAIVVKTFLKMSDKHIKAFRMRTLEGSTYAEIAAALGVSVGYAFRLIEQVMVEIYLALDD